MPVKERENILFDILRLEKGASLTEEDKKILTKKLILFRKYYDKLPEEFSKRLIKLDEEILRKP